MYSTLNVTDLNQCERPPVHQIVVVIGHIIIGSFNLNTRDLNFGCYLILKLYFYFLRLRISFR